MMNQQEMLLNKQILKTVKEEIRKGKFTDLFIKTASQKVT
jgi:hypothetical protein